MSVNPNRHQQFVRISRKRAYQLLQKESKYIAGYNTKTKALTRVEGFSDLNADKLFYIIPKDDAENIAIKYKKKELVHSLAMIGAVMFTLIFMRWGMDFLEETPLLVHKNPIFHTIILIISGIGSLVSWHQVLHFGQFSPSYNEELSQDYRDIIDKENS